MGTYQGQSGPHNPDETYVAHEFPSNSSTPARCS